MQLIEIMQQKNLFGSWKTDSNGKMVESIYTDKAAPHTYIQNFYEEEFKKYQNEKINFLEIGICSGGSFLLWSEYFKNPNIIVGVDCTDEYLHPKCKNIESVDYYFNDAYDIDFVSTIPSFDIIIEDGQHTLETQIKCLKMYLPKLNKGGVLIIEDIQSENHFENLIEISKTVSENDNEDVEYEVECLDFRNSPYHKNSKFVPPDDMLFIVRKN